ncbi:MAG: biotin/lipoyl-containing protein, partial [Acidimicrobiales bacterium]
MTVPISVPTDCTVVDVLVDAGAEVAADAIVAIVEMMKIEHLVRAPEAGVVSEIRAEPGQVLKAGAVIATLIPGATGAQSIDEVVTAAADRADLAELRARRELLTDDARPEAVAKIHGRGRRTARENLADLVDEGSFQEYGSFMYAAQKGRRDIDDLIANTPGDGIVGGLATVNADLFGEADAHVAVMSYDYTVLAGTQGFRGHEKKDRLLSVAHQLEVPL